MEERNGARPPDPGSPPAARRFAAFFAPPVRYAALSPDGRALLAASDDTLAMTLWDVENGVPRRTLPRPPRDLFFVGGGWWVGRPAFADDGANALLLLNAGDRLVEWNAAAGEARTVFVPDAAYGAFSFIGGHLAPSPDGHRLAAVHADSLRAVRVWDRHTGRLTATMALPEGSNAFDKIAWSPDGAWLLAGHEKGMATLYRAADGMPAAHLNVPSMSRASGSGVAFSPRGDVALTAWAGTIRVWSENRAVAVFPRGAGSADWLPTGGADGRWRARETPASPPIARREDHAAEIVALAVSPRDGMPVTVDRTGAIMGWPHGREETPWRLLPSSAEVVTALTFSPDGMSLLAAGAASSIENGRIQRRTSWRILDPATGAERARWPEARLQAAFSPDGRLVAGAGDGEFADAGLYDADDGRCLTALDVPVLPQSLYRSEVNELAFTPDGTHVLALNRDAAVLWETATGRVAETWTTSDPDVALVMMPDGRIVGSHELWPESAAWAAESLPGLRLFRNPNRRCRAVAPDGRRAVIGSYNRLWLIDWRTGRGKAFAWDRDAAGSPLIPAFSPDGKWLYGAIGKILFVWTCDEAGDLAEPPEGPKG